MINLHEFSRLICWLLEAASEGVQFIFSGSSLTLRAVSPGVTITVEVNGGPSSGGWGEFFVSREDLREVIDSAAAVKRNSDADIGARVLVAFRMTAQPKAHVYISFDRFEFLIGSQRKRLPKRSAKGATGRVRLEDLSWEIDHLVKYAGIRGYCYEVSKNGRSAKIEMEKPNSLVNKITKEVY